MDPCGFLVLFLCNCALAQAQLLACVGHDQRHLQTCSAMRALTDPVLELLGAPTMHQSHTLASSARMRVGAV